jgi:hypothetical protein
MGPERRAGAEVRVGRSTADSIDCVAADLGHRWQLDLAPYRRLGGAMLGLGLLLPALPHRPGLPCPLRTLTGIPCPLCGMTTSVEAGVRLDARSAFAANPFGLVAIAVAVALLLRPAWRRVALPIGMLVGAAVASELFQLHRFHYL